MSYVLYHSKEQGRPQKQKLYSTRKGALIGMRAANRAAGYSKGILCGVNGAASQWAERAGQYDYAPYVVLPEAEFEKRFPLGTKRVRNLMTGQMVEIAEDTPHCCDPSTETYWSM